VIKTYLSTAKKKNEKLEAKAGMNRFVWNMRYPDAKGFEGLIMWGASLTGPKALPGSYKARLSINDQSMETEFEILPDPRSTSTPADMKAQFDFLIEVREKMTETNQGVSKIRNTRKQIKSVLTKIEDEELKKTAKEIMKQMKAIEEELYQTKNQSRQDPLNYPIRLNNKLGHLNSLMGRGDFRPTDQNIEFQKEVSGLIDEQLQKLNTIIDNDIPKLNKMIRDLGIDAISIDEEKKEDSSS